VTNRPIGSVDGSDSRTRLGRSQNSNNSMSSFLLPCARCCLALTQFDTSSVPSSTVKSSPPAGKHKPHFFVWRISQGLSPISESKSWTTSRSAHFCGQNVVMLRLCPLPVTIREKILPTDWGSASKEEENPSIHSFSVVLERAISVVFCSRYIIEQKQACCTRGNSSDGGSSLLIGCVRGTGLFMDGFLFDALIGPVPQLYPSPCFGESRVGVYQDTSDPPSY
jgi:hypothetical protein